MSVIEGKRRLTLAATILGSSLAFIDATVVVVALPTIDADLELGLTGQQWVFLSYSLALAAFYMVGGAVGDRWGLRNAFVGGAAAFAVTSLAAGAAPNEAVLLAARSLQGVAGAFLTTNSLALLRAAYGADAGRAIGLWTAFVSGSTVIGPPVGGAIVEWISWRWIFLVNLPLAGVAVALALAGRTHERAIARQGRFDLAGAALCATGLGFLTFALVEEAWWALPVGVVALAVFVVVELRVGEPLVPRELLGFPNVLVANVVTFLVYAALGGFGLFSSLYLQFLGLSAFETGLLWVVPSVVLLVGSARVGEISGRRGPRGLLTAGPVLLAAGLALFALVDEREEAFWLGGISILVFSVGLTFIVAPITTAALAGAPESLSGIASGLNQTVARVGGLLAAAAMGFVVAFVFAASAPRDGQPLALDQRDPELRAASVDAFRAGMGVAVALSLAGAGVAAAGLRGNVAKGDPGPGILK